MDPGSLGRKLFSFSLGYQITPNTNVRIKKLDVDGKLIGTSNNFGIWRLGEADPFRTFSLSGSGRVATDVALVAGTTYVVAGVFRLFTETPPEYLYATSHFSQGPSLYIASTSLAKPTLETPGYYGFVNFKYTLD